MAENSINYMGLKLANPIIVGSSNIVDNPVTLKAMEDAGAAAVVFKSLFEEQIQLESLQFHTEMELYNERNAESINLFPGMEYAGPAEHLHKLRKAKQALNIPLIGSLNCVFTETWIDWAKQIEETGVDGLELNFFSIPRDFETTSSSIEQEQIAIVKQVCDAVSIPVSVKLSPFYTNTINVVRKMREAGAKAFVLFNRIFEPDISLNSLKHISPFNLSEPGDYRMSLRYIGILHKNINASLIGSNGIHTGADVIKLILAGADAVQIVSTVYLNSPSVISEILGEIRKFMEANNFASYEDFRGKLSRQNTRDPFVYKRAQYIDLLLHSEKLIKPDRIV
ncbi:MAG TPA: dihydroorotate dehydrogenase-like protein [Lentimicrobium sp.]|nr:dihydroorotate dehydrogenase-like protein [Lentimicrobium sp.]